MRQVLGNRNGVDSAARVPTYLQLGGHSGIALGRPGLRGLLAGALRTEIWTDREVDEDGEHSRLKLDSRRSRFRRFDERRLKLSGTGRSGGTEVRG